MIHKLKLQFTEEGIENEYLELQKDNILSSYLTFTCYVSIFCLIQIINFGTQGQFIFPIVSIIAIVLVGGSYFYLKKHPNKIDWIVIIQQLFVLLSFKLDNFLSSEEKSNHDFSWYYGFQCAFLHFSLFLQGTNFLAQIIILLLVFILHLISSENEELTQEAILNYVTFLWVYFSMISIKFNIEKQKRKEYISQKERYKLQNLMENVAYSYTLLIRFDKKQDQIRMETCNNLFQEKYNINNDKQMRIFLRNFVIKNKNINRSLEKIVRSIIRNKPESNFQTQNNIILQFNGYLKNQKDDTFKIKIAPYYQNNQKLCLIVFTQDVQNQLIKKLRAYNELKDNAIQQLAIQNLENYKWQIGIQQKLLSIKRNNKIIRIRLQNCYQIFNNHLNYLKFFDEQNVGFYQLCKTDQHISKTLKNAFGSKVQIQNSIDQFKTNIQIINQILLSLIQALINFTHSKEQVKVTINKSSYLKIVLTKKINDDEFQFWRLLNKNWVNLNSQISIKDQIYSFWQKLIQKLLKSSLRIDYLSAMDLAITQVLIAKMGPYNHVKVHQENDQLCLTVYFYEKQKKLSLIPQKFDFQFSINNNGDSHPLI